MKGLCRLLLGLGVLTSSLSAAPVDAFLKLPGIPGESQNPAHSNWISIASVSTSAAYNDFPQFVPLLLRKTIDRSSPLLARHCASGKVLSNAVVEFTLPAATNQRFFQITLSNVVVTSYLIEGSYDRPLESFELTYSAFTWRYTEVPNLGSKHDYVMNWDVLQNTGGLGNETLWLYGTCLNHETFQLSWLAQQGAEYRILASTNATDSADSYTFIQSVRPSYSGTLTTNISIGSGQRFFIVEKTN